MNDTSLLDAMTCSTVLPKTNETTVPKKKVPVVHGYEYELLTKKKKEFGVPVESSVSLASHIRMCPAGCSPAVFTRPVCSIPMPAPYGWWTALRCYDLIRNRGTHARFPIPFPSLCYLHGSIAESWTVPYRYGLDP